MWTNSGTTLRMLSFPLNRTDDFKIKLRMKRLYAYRKWMWNESQEIGKEELDWDNVELKGQVGRSFEGKRGSSIQLLYEILRSLCTTYANETASQCVQQASKCNKFCQRYFRCVRKRFCTCIRQSTINNLTTNSHFLRGGWNKTHMKMPPPWSM